MYVVWNADGVWGAMTIENWNDFIYILNINAKYKIENAQLSEYAVEHVEKINIERNDENS